MGRKGWLASLLACLGLCLSLCLPGQSLVRAATGDNRLTIVHVEHDSEIEPHELTDKPTDAHQPVAGVAYLVFQVEDTADQSRYAFLRTLTPAELLERYPVSYQGQTDSQGRVQFTNLANGTYFGLAVHKQEALDTVQPFLIQLPFKGEKGFEKDVTIYPKLLVKKGKLLLRKLDGDSQSPLAGVEFSLYHKGGTSPLRVKNGVFTTDMDGGSQLVTDASGQIRVGGLVPGEYWVKETQALSGYQSATESAAFSIRAEEETELVLTNYQIKEGGRRFRKIDASRSEIPLKGAEFRVLDSQGRPVQRQGQDYRVTSQDDGYFEVTGLAFGTYYLEETKAPTVKGVAYERLTQAIAFEVSASSYDDGTIWSIVNRPKQSFLPSTGSREGDVALALALVVGVFYLMKKRKYETNHPS